MVLAAVTDNAKPTAPKQQIGVPFQPGQSGNPAGRPKGSRNKLAEAFVADLHDDWLANGKAVIETVRAEKPDQYMKVIASIIPKDVNLNVSNVDEMSDAELAERIRTLATQLAPFIADGTGNAVEGDEGSAGAQLASRVH